MTTPDNVAGCNHLPDLLIPSDARVECPSRGAIWKRDRARGGAVSVSDVDDWLAT